MKWETRSNGAALRSAEPIAIEHFEIPLSIVRTFFHRSLEKEVRESLIFEKDGAEFIRWIINPEDTQYANWLSGYLKSKGLDSTRHRRFVAYFTASRSLIIEDPKTGAEFSAKVGTNRTGGEWRNKNLTALQAKQAAITTDEIENLQTKIRFNRCIFLEEPASFAIEEARQGYVIRSLKSLHEKPDHYYLPAFSAVHEKTGREIASLNGSDDPAKFWMENAVDPIARAQAEFVVTTGRAPEAGHWQNYLIELDHGYRPTGRVVFRDFSDSDILRLYHREYADQSSLKAWPENHLKWRLQIASGPLHGNAAPSWLKEGTQPTESLSYDNWQERFFAAFENELTTLTGLAGDDFYYDTGDKKIGYRTEGRYRIKYYTHMDTPRWKEHLKFAECYRGAQFSKDGTPCPNEVLDRLKKYRCEGLLKPVR